MDLELAGKWAIVTGASQGIGLAVAESLAAEGCNLHLVSRSREKLDKARAALLRGRRCAIEIHPFDLSRSESIAAVAALAGEVDILVNNAGSIPQGDLLAIDEAAWRAAWELKVFGFINLTREIYRAMRARRTGVIVNVIGSAGERPSAGYIAGTTGNAGLMQFTRALGGESVDFGIRVVGVNPGNTETERQTLRWEARAETELGDKSRWRELVTGAPFGRLATPREVADVVAFLASNRASYVSGTIVTIDGGRMARLKD
jgi:3-oxoacyl-[acyl-carrier protein] reductase